MTAIATPSSRIAGTGRRPTDHRCTACGYGIAQSSPPYRCPMCGGSGDTWVPSQVVGPA